MRTPRNRRERPAKPALSRATITDAAARVLDVDGFERLTMRRLAADLDTAPASLYVYVRNTVEIHALLLDRLLAELDVSWDGGRDWHERLRILLVDYGALLQAHPGLARSALSTWPEGPHYLDLVELMLRLLTTGGVPADRAAWGVDLLLQQATALAAERGAREHDGQQMSDLVRVLDGADPQRHPILSELGSSTMTSGRGVDRRDWAIAVLITGITEVARGRDAPG